MFRVPSPGNVTVRLAWDPNTEPDVLGYKVYYGVDGSPDKLLATLGLVTSYVTNPLPKRAYWFGVTAYTATSESDISNIVVSKV